jgi:Xaa-Pro aminopeptidase
MTTNPLFEYEVEGLFLFQCDLCGALQQAYLPIVGSGNNGAILHYIANNEELTDGELLLIDAGGEYWGYGSDITRTYPVNGVFTAAQTLIYNIVLQTQADVAAITKPGVSWTTLNTVARESITRYLLNAGLIQGAFQDLINNAVYNIFYPHGIGHSVGLDVHDSQTTILAANQVITIEPGVYFNSYLLDQALVGTRSRFIVWDAVNAYRGTGGVRIEDDYVITATGCTPITTVPSSIEAIQKIMSPQ